MKLKPYSWYLARRKSRSFAEKAMYDSIKEHEHALSSYTPLRAFGPPIPPGQGVMGASLREQRITVHVDTDAAARAVELAQAAGQTTVPFHAILHK